MKHKPIPKELITNLRNAKRRWGVNFDRAIKQLISGELSLEQGKRGRPPFPELALTQVWSMIKAIEEHKNISEAAAKMAYAKRGENFRTVVQGHGGQKVIRRVRIDKLSTVNTLYREARKRRNHDPGFMQLTDWWVSINLTLLKAESSSEDVFEKIISEHFE